MEYCKVLVHTNILQLPETVTQQFLEPLAITQAEGFEPSSLQFYGLWRQLKLKDFEPSSL